jgi:Domain of unknown function (DUF1905)
VTPAYGGAFTAQLRKYPGKGGWHFATVPSRLAPPVTHGWGRTPVRATVGGVTWDTSVWRGKAGATVIAIPKRVRCGKTHGDSVRIRLSFGAL